MVSLGRSPVHVVRATYDDLPRVMERFSQVLPDREVAAAATIALKVNLCDARTPETGATTDPRFLDALMGHLRTRNPTARIVIVESDGIAVLADRYRRWFGVDEVLERWGGSWVNLTQEPEVAVPIRGAHLHSVPVPRILTESLVISLTKLKTNLVSTMTGALKNQFGCLPMIDKFKFHPDIGDVIRDVNLAVRPVAFLVDGIVGHGGIQGPSFGTPIRANVVLAGRDPVAVDAAACQVLGYNPLAVSHVRKSWLSGRGSIRFQVVGDPLPHVDFENHGFEIQVFRWGGRIKRLYQRWDRQHAWRRTASSS